MLCSECRKNIGKELRERTTRVNEALHLAGLRYHNTIADAVHVVDVALMNSNFTYGDSQLNTIAPGEYRIHGEVGDGRFLTVCLHEMPSGRYELVAYVN